MSLRFIINIDTEGKDQQEIEFWPGRKKAQAREITRQGVVSVDREMDMQKVIDGLLGAIKEGQAEAGLTEELATVRERSRIASEGHQKWFEESQRLRCNYEAQLAVARGEVEKLTKDLAATTQHMQDAIAQEANLEVELAAARAECSQCKERAEKAEALNDSPMGVNYWNKEANAARAERDERDATIKALTDRIKVLTEVAAAAHDRLETYKRGEMTTNRDTHVEWGALRSALLVAGMLKEDL